MNTNTANTFTKTLWVSKKSAFEDKIKHLNRLLKKQGKSPITFKYENYRMLEVEFTLHNKGDAFRNDIHETRSVEVCDAVCTGTLEVKKDDQPYTYLGTVSIQDGIRQVFCKDEAYAPYFTDLFRPNFCDHCHTTRSNRKSYHLFLDPSTSKVLQIGSTCAKEFFGIDSSAFLETYGRTFFVSYEGPEEDLSDFSRGSLCFSYNEILPALSYATRGFLKWQKKDSGYFPELPFQDQPTSMAVASLLDSPEDYSSIPDQSTNTSLISYEEVLAFWSAKYAAEHSTFAFNCLSAVQAGYATSRSLGSFCYAVFAAFNHKVRSIQNAQAAALHTVVPCPFPVGSRADIVGTVTNIRKSTFENPYTANYYNNYWGDEYTAYIVDFAADNGTLYHFTTSGVTFHDIKPNTRVSLRATIGDTKPFKGIPYTRLSRPKATILPPETKVA